MARAERESEETKGSEGNEKTNRGKEKKVETKKRKETQLAMSSKAKMGKRLL
jgi:hypothetical protein